MKEIKLVISDEVYRDLRTALQVKWLCQMSGPDLTLAIIERLLKSLDNNEPVCEFIYKSERKE